MNENKRAFLLIWLPPFLWMSFIVLLSSIPGAHIPDVPIPNASGIVHFLEYSVLGLLLSRGFSRSMPGMRLFTVAFLAAASALLFAISDEWHQTFVPGRFCELEDLIVDAISAVLGILWYVRFREKAAGPKKQDRQ